jgi:hypothetical protein
MGCTSLFFLPFYALAYIKDVREENNKTKISQVELAINELG